MSTLKVTNIQQGGATNIAMVLDTAGTVQHYSTISVGNATPSASGAGVTFPATQSASTNVNTLDDYEEGTFTATLVPGTSGTITLRSDRDLMSYTKIGRLVSISGTIVVESGSSPVGTTVSLQGLPFSTAGETENDTRSTATIRMVDYSTGSPGSGGTVAITNAIGASSSSIVMNRDASKVVGSGGNESNFVVQLTYITST